MAGNERNYKSKTVYNNKTLTASETLEGFKGFGDCEFLFARLNVNGDVSGGADTYDCKIQTKIGNDWFDIITFTQKAAAGSENKGYVRSATQGWGDLLRVVSTLGAGATAAGVDLTITGF